MADEKREGGIIVRRLIDADALRQTIESKIYWGGIGLLEAIDEAHTVDAVEVVHGRWIADGWFTKRCSVCRSVPLREVGGRHDACYSNYCPNCGAKMDSEEEQHDGK